MAELKSIQATVGSVLPARNEKPVYSVNGMQAWKVIESGFAKPEEDKNVSKEERDILVYDGILGEDRIKVSFEYGRIYVVAEESGMTDLSDWIRNFDLGNDPIYDLNDNVVGDGYDGFVVCANQRRKEIVASMEKFCTKNGTTLKDCQVVYAGYSRGGGIAQAIIYMHVKSGLINANNAFLYTFGSPRCLQAQEADELHNILGDRAERYVEGNDPVPALPFSSLGSFFTGSTDDSYKHVGVVKAIRAKRDFPKVAKLWRVLDHLTYGARVQTQLDSGPRSRL